MLQKSYLALKTFASRRVEPWDDLLVDRAFEFASLGHLQQLRESGESYIFHPLEVARIVAAMRCDLVTFLAALLHDVIEDTDIGLEQVSDSFGTEVSFIVDAVTKTSPRKRSLPMPSERRSEESMRKVIVGCAKNLGVAYVKLADRLHNLTTLEARPAQRRKRTLDETHDYIAPLAGTLGIGYLQRELSYWFFRLAYPEVSKRYSMALSEHREGYRHEVGEVWYKFASELQRQGVSATKIEMDPRHCALEVEPAGALQEWFTPYDLTIVMNFPGDCYLALGILHSQWPVLAGHCSDSMEYPLPNGYSALHTAIQTNSGRIIRTRLQTEEMHRRSEWGPLCYLRGVSDYEMAFRRLPQAETLDRISELDSTIEPTDDFLEYVRLDILTPQMRVFMSDGFTHLPVGATVLDLAYSKAAMMPNRCCGALVNGKETRVETVLHDGDTVQLLTEEIPGPDKRWRFGKAYKTAAAKHAIDATR